MQILTRNRAELYWSAALLFGSLIAGHIFDYSKGVWQVMIVVVACFRFMALLCVVNAIADQKRMLPIERVLSVPWLLFVVYFTITAVWQCIRFEPYIPWDR